MHTHECACSHCDGPVMAFKAAFKVGAWRDTAICQILPAPAHASNPVGFQTRSGAVGKKGGPGGGDMKKGDDQKKGGDMGPKKDAGPQGGVFLHLFCHPSPWALRRATCGHHIP